MIQKTTLQIHILLKKGSKVPFFLFFVWLFFFIEPIFSQDSIPEKKDLTEEKALKFQEFFFKALSEKAIENYQKAIENLESCNQILENQIAVFFEFSKNYYELNNIVLAKEYVQRALQKEPENLWMLKHLVMILQKESNFNEAIKLQEKITENHPNERESLVRLYFINDQPKEALAVLLKMEQENGLNSEFSFLKKKLTETNNPVIEETKTNDIEGLISQFQTDKSYSILENILQRSEKKNDTLLLFSKEGISLFPEQPFVYLQHGKALNQQNEFQKALNSLKNGLDFVIDVKMEIEFYSEIAKAYKGLGNAIEEKKYRQKATLLKN